MICTHIFTLLSIFFVIYFLRVKPRYGRENAILGPDMCKTDCSYLYLNIYLTSQDLDLTSQDRVFNCIETCVDLTL